MALHTPCHAHNWASLEKLPRDILAEIQVVRGKLGKSFHVDEAVRACGLVFHLTKIVANQRYNI